MRTRTGYSFRTAYGHLHQVMAALKAQGAKVAPISDRMSTFGFNRWTKLCKKNDIRPMYGVELAVVAALGEKKPVVDYWCFWATKDLVELNAAIALATENPGKEPSLTIAQAMQFKNLIKVAGERVLLPHLEPYKRSKDLFISLSPATPLGLARKAHKAGYQLLAQPDNYYPTEADKETYRVALGFKANTQTYPMHILGTRALDELLSKQFQDAAMVNLALHNTSRLITKCTAELGKAEMLVPKKKKTLEAMCREGAKHLGVNLKTVEYRTRLEKELALIASKKFEDYFYIIADMVNWAKARMVVGPARGSSCGSLVCYLLGITAIDPIPYELIFERFIDVNRTDLPDIDIDFSDVNRNLVFEYAEQKYGKEHVARLGTVGMFKPRSALKQCAAQLRIPTWEIEKVNDNIVERSSGDARALQTLEDTLRDTETGTKILNKYPELIIAANMEGHPNNASQHAAGVVITKAPVAQYVSVDMRTRSVMCDKKDAEDLNLLKIDALGLTQLSVFERCMELIGEQPVSGWLERLPLDDQAAFDVLNAGKFSGIFQFMGPSLRGLSNQIHFSKLEDIVSITALARPGPLGSGGAFSWVKRHSGQEKVTYPHELFEPQLRNTLGIIMYQEQVMTIGREIGGLSWEDVTDLRKAMSKSLGKEFFDKYGDRWKAGAIKKGIPKHVLDKVWDDMCAYGAWAFNRSHAVAYGMVSYWCCWLKAHHPVEFAAATLDAETEPAKQLLILRELADEGIDYMPVDPETSTDKWTVTIKNKKKFLVGPLTQIKGFGPATISEILTARKKGEELRPAVAKRMLNAQTDIDNLFPIAARIKQLDLEAKNIYSKPWNVADCQCGVEDQVMILAVVQKINPKDENEHINVLKRGYEIKDGRTRSLGLFFYDDTGDIYAKIDRYNFERLAPKIIDRGRIGNAIYAVKGTIPKGFRMISIKAIRYLGDMNPDHVEEKEEEQ